MVFDADGRLVAALPQFEESVSIFDIEVRPCTASGSSTPGVATSAAPLPEVVVSAGTRRSPHAARVGAPLAEPFNHKKNPSAEIMAYGQERVAETIRLCKMNLAVHGLSGDIRQANTYYEDIHQSVGKFDFVMANPPFNVDKVDKEKIKDDPRFPFGMPKADNANYLWIEIFYSALEREGPGGVRDGEFRRRRARHGVGDSQEAD